MGYHDLMSFATSGNAKIRRRLKDASFGGPVKLRDVVLECFGTCCSRTTLTTAKDTSVMPTASPGMRFLLSNRTTLRSPKQAPFNGKALFMKVRWENAWKLFHEAKWPGAHRVPCEMDASSGHGNPFHRCSRCKELVRRSQLHATRCSKDSSKKSGPTPKRRAQLWKGWFKAASVAAKAACKEAKKARDTRSDASETSRLRRQSAARLLSASEVAKCTKCGHLVSRDHLPVERCPAAKAKAFPALKARQAEWPRSWLRMLAASGAVSRLCRRRDSAAGSFW